MGRLVAISVGLALASSCFPLLATTVASLGGWSLLAIAGSGLLAWLVSRCYGELAATYPTAAGVRTYVGQAFGSRRGLALALLYLFLVVGLGASESTILSHVLHAAYPGLSPLPVCLVFIALSALANVLGIEPAGRLQSVLTYGMVGGLGAGALALLAPSTPHVEVAQRAALGGVGPLVAGLGGAIFLFVGFEWVVAAVEKPDSTGRELPRAMSWSIGIITALYALLALAFWLVLPASALVGLTPHLALGTKGLGRIGLHAFAALSIAATITSFNGGILGASRLCYALAREGVLPRKLATLSPRFFTPWVAILAMSGLTAASAVLLAGTNACRVPILVGAAIECGVFAAVALAFAKLRAPRLHARCTRVSLGDTAYVAPFGPRTGVVLAVVFAALGVACVVAAGEWALAATATLAVIATTTGVIAWTARTGPSSASKRSAASSPRSVSPSLTFARSAGSPS